MKVLCDEKEYRGPGAVLALGMFDGVHLGHRALILRAAALAKELGGDAVVCTFDRHPLSVLCPGSEPEALTTPEERLRIFGELGADQALVKPFTRELASCDPTEFLRKLASVTRAKAIVCGESYTFGKNGAGDAALMRKMAAELGCRVEIVPSVRDGEEVVSSTLIRSLLAKGDRERAEYLLGKCQG